MNLPQINTPSLTAYYDDTSKLTHVIYRGQMTAQMTIDVYRWILSLAAYIDVADVRGSIYDFREVPNFDRYSLSTVQRESRNLNFNLDVSNIPVALVVKNLIQESMVRIGMKVSPQEHRKKIVMSEADALQFFATWHAEHGKQSSV